MTRILRNLLMRFAESLRVCVEQISANFTFFIPLIKVMLLFIYFWYCSTIKEKRRWFGRFFLQENNSSVACLFG